LWSSSVKKRNVQGWNSRRVMAPRGDWLLERGRLWRTQPQGRYRHETRLDRVEAECKAQEGEKPDVPATWRR
jgi:hypothetical protein